MGSGLEFSTTQSRPAIHKTPEKGDFYTATFDRHYKDNAGERKSSQSFPQGDLLELAKAADKAHDRIMELQRKNL
jgi:hypothetical protein